MEYRTKYCIVGNRPVKGIMNQNGGLGVYAFNWETGEFDYNYDYMKRIYWGDVESGETEEVTKEEFEAYVEKLKKERGL